VLSRWRKQDLDFAIKLAETAHLPGLLNERKAKQTTIAYICSGMSCKKPITNQEEFRTSLPGDTAN